ncbi:MAG: serine/threonine-protein phosphatase [Chloroflexi bacterium]|nr:serine/threonine-protein phosphatase [Chloroflexota bacterium]
MLDDRDLQSASQSFLDYALLSHKGWVRSNNEDCILAKVFSANDSNTVGFAVVLCDGVGGHQSGEVAARIGAETVIAHIGEYLQTSDPVRLLKDAVISANSAILKAYADNPEQEGMAATCLAILLIEHHLYLASLGDSRAYLLREGTLHQLNHDHTWLEDSLGAEIGPRKGITRSHPLAHVLSRYLGSTQVPEVDLRIRAIAKPVLNETQNQGMPLIAGDRLLICSDGLTDMLNDHEIVENMVCDSARKNAQKLVLSALEKGGHDNVSVIVVHQSK